MSAPAAIPAPSDRLVGRRRELAELESLLEEERLLALMGPTGIGKSALARALNRRKRRVLHLDCASDEVDVVRALAAALGKRDAADPARAVRDSLASRRSGVLVVLDGLERLPEGLPERISTWLATSPDVGFLVTSTRLLPLPGARFWETPPLSPEDGVDLLVDRATRQGAEGWSGADRRPLHALVERLDGSPLALVLAAARSRTMRPRQLLALLDRGLEALRTPGDGRHASAEAAARWMWERLSPAERGFLEIVSVFEAGFPLEALEAITLPGGRPSLELLAALRDASALRLEGDRYRIPAMLRWYAERSLERKDPSDALRTRRAHASWCIGLFSVHPGDDEALPTLTRERVNLLAAHRFGLEHDPEIAAWTAQGLGRVHAIHGPSDEEEAIKNAGVEAARRSGNRELLARLLRDRSILEIRLGRLAEARIDLDEFETIARALGDRLLEAQAGIEHGRLRFAQGDFETAQVLLARAIGTLEAHDPSRDGGSSTAKGGARRRPSASVPASVPIFLLGYAHNLLGMVREAQGRLAESARCFETALDLFRRAGNRRYRAVAMMNLGVARYVAGELDPAVSLFEQTIAAARAVGDRAGEADALLNLGSVLLLKGNLGEAERYLRQSLELEKELGNRRAHAMALGDLGIAAHERGELRTAEELLRAAVDTARLAGDRNFWAIYLAFHGAVSASLGDRAGAAASLASARSWFESLGDPGHLATVCMLEAFLHLSDPKARDERMADAWALVDESGKGSRSTGIRLAARMVQGAVGRLEGRPVGGRRATRLLEIGPETGWFRIGGETVDLGRRLTARRLLRALVERRLSAPGVGVSSERLAAAGWPDEHGSAELMANRVYVAINTMRRLGLRDAILRRDDGYLLDPGLAVRSSD